MPHGELIQVRRWTSGARVLAAHERVGLADLGWRVQVGGLDRCREIIPEA